MRFPVYPNLRKVIRERPLATDAAFLEGALVVTTAGELDECGADPELILGCALHDAGADPDTTICLVALATAESTFVMQGSAAPVEADVGVRYGVAKDADGVWFVDKAKVLEAVQRVVVEDIHPEREQYEVRVLAANRQNPG